MLMCCRARSCTIRDGVSIFLLAFSFGIIITPSAPQPPKLPIPALCCLKEEAQLQSVNPLMRLRGGHRMPNKKRRNALEQHRSSRRIHSATRIKPRDLRRMRERREAQQAEQEQEAAAPVNLTEALLNFTQPKLRLWETTMGKTMNSINEFKKRCPEVWEEELNCRRDGVANVYVSDWREVLEVPKDEEEARFRDHDDEWKRMRGIAHYNLALCYETGYAVEGVDLGKAFAHYKASGELKHPEGMCNVGCCYLSAHGCAYDEEKGVRWIRRAAEAGSFEGQFNLGLCFRRGVGVEVDERAALRWLNASACNKHPDGMYAMAMCYKQGYGGLTPNPGLAVTMLSRVVDKYDHAASLLTLGQCLLDGDGVTMDRDMGMKLVAMAAKFGWKEAKEELEARMQAEERGGEMAVDAG